MLKVLRKNNKKILAVVGVFLMIAFIIPSFAKRPGRGPQAEVVGQIGDEKIYANAYSQALSNIFTTQMKPYEVEILVAQVGDTPAESSLFHILFDGSVADEDGYVAMGGKADELTERLKGAYQPGGSVQDMARLAVETLSAVEERTFEPDRLEVAVLDRTRARRKFRRLGVEDVAGAVAPTA